jgi:signal transduction histidine kinase
VSDIVSALLTKTLRSSTFKLALICIAIFGAVVFALIGYVYWSTASYVRSQADLVHAVLETLPDGAHRLVGQQIGDLAAFTGNIEIALAGGALLLAVLAAAMSIAVTRRTVGRIESINATSRAIMQSGPGAQSGFGTRIPLRGTRDEWDHVAENLNLMLDRIEVLMGEVRQATDNVAHDLRTPLARMRGRLEKAYGRTRDTALDQALIGDTLADLDAVLRIFASLTRISQIEASDRTLAFRAVNLSEIAGKVVELFDAAAEDRHIRLRSTGEQHVLATGDADLLFDAVANLVDNAIKHGREGGEVIVDVAQEREGPALCVADDGTGIAPHEHQNVFRRFYRLEKSRSTPGNGLGLALVAAVARSHGARIEMIDNLPGLKFRLLFPGATNLRGEGRGEAVPH